MPLSNKQIESFAHSDKRINIWCGAVRSGKTYSSILKLIYLLQEGPPGNALIVGVTRESVQTNVINDLCEMLGISPISSKSNEVEILGRRVRILGANDLGSVRKIQGSTLAIAYVDEAAVIPESFFTMLLSRLSKEGATLLATANPEGPYHWLKTKFIDKESDLDLRYFDFELDDNPALPQAYKDAIKKEYTGVWYNRMILGQWAVAEGLVYDSFDEQNQIEEKPSNANYYIAGLDYGTTNPTACVLVGVNLNGFPKVWVEDEYVYNSKEALRAKADWELANDIEEFLRPYYVKHLYVDPSAASLKIELRRRKIPIRDANNDVIPGIKIVGGMVSTKELAVCKKCKTLIKELHTYSWDPKAADRGQDAVLKEFDHNCDALRYCIATHFPHGLEARADRDYSNKAVRERVFGRSKTIQEMLDTY